jgi:DNA-binding SARP family transcriptional activator
LTDSGHTWLLGTDVDWEELWPSGHDELVWLPLLVPVGDDAGGTYLLHLEPGQELSLGGPQAKAMLAAWAQAAESWPWSEQVSVANDAEAAEALAPLFADQTGVDERGTAMFVGDPAELSEKARRTVATVTPEPNDSGTSVVATPERAFIEPFGITVRPCLLGEATAHTLAGIFDGPSRIRAVKDSRERSGPHDVVMGSMSSGAEFGGPGPIEVRLLTFTPQIVGLATPLSSNMVVRITELVAWVALQGEKGTTAASMVDHGIVGATATKTVYNMVSAARAALGVDASGAPLLSTDRSTGTYRLSDEVTVDVLRFEQMAERGIDTEDPQLAALLCEAALALIDDTPVGNGTGRYGWWSSMWEARIGRLATKAAGRLAELARHGVIDIEVARRGIEQARLTAGGEEALHRVAMVLEAWAGNDTQVELEWETVCTQAEDLEPGCAPSEDTEALLIAIRRRRLDEVLAAQKG